MRSPDDFPKAGDNLVVNEHEEGEGDDEETLDASTLVGSVLVLVRALQPKHTPLGMARQLLFRLMARMARRSRTTPT